MMNRRGFFASVFAMTAIPLMKLIPRSQLGSINVRENKSRFDPIKKVYLDGEDITSVCCEANQQAGTATVYEHHRDSDGVNHIIPSRAGFKLKTIALNGKIELVLESGLRIA